MPTGSTTPGPCKHQVGEPPARGPRGEGLARGARAFAGAAKGRNGGATEGFAATSPEPLRRIPRCLPLMPQPLGGGRRGRLRPGETAAPGSVPCPAIRPSQAEAPAPGRVRKAGWVGLGVDRGVW